MNIQELQKLSKVERMNLAILHWEHNRKLAAQNVPIKYLGRDCVLCIVNGLTGNCFDGEYPCPVAIFSEYQDCYNTPFNGADTCPTTMIKFLEQVRDSLKEEDNE